MSMKIDDLISQVDSLGRSQAIKVNEGEKRRSAEIQRNEDIILTYIDDMLKLKELASTLAKNNLGNSILFTNSWEHKMGLYQEGFKDVRINGEYRIIYTPSDFFGIEGGGCYHCSLVIDLITKKIIADMDTVDDDNTAQDTYLCYLREVADNFPSWYKTMLLKIKEQLNNCE